MGIVVFDSDVLIGFLWRNDAHHARATRLVEEVTELGSGRQVCAVNYAEILVGPERAGVRDVLDDTLARLVIDVVYADDGLAADAAHVRGETGLKLPDAFVLATALRARQRGRGEVQIATFDRAVQAAAARLLAT